MICFPTRVREGLEACGRLNNESDLAGNEELRLCAPALESLFSPLVGSGAADY